ncbi:hypothetical protein RB195_020844 [Necator americanus]|uniref:Uncharacterized protein n=1 Tax=Necator americanus TaxID=51031 RepID=A0ABR1CM87_NECAM
MHVLLISCLAVIHVVFAASLDLSDLSLTLPIRSSLAEPQVPAVIEDASWRDKRENDPKTVKEALELSTLRRVKRQWGRRRRCRRSLRAKRFGGFGFPFFGGGYPPFFGGGFGGGFGGCCCCCCCCCGYG